MKDKDSLLSKKKRKFQVKPVYLSKKNGSPDEIKTSLLKKNSDLGDMITPKESMEGLDTVITEIKTNKMS